MMTFTTFASPDILASASNFVEFRKEVKKDTRENIERSQLTCEIENSCRKCEKRRHRESAGKRHERTQDKSSYRRGSANSLLKFHGARFSSIRTASAT